jgi:hypothetical protein
MLQYTQGGVRDSIDCRAAPRLEHVPDTECTSYKFLSMLVFFSLRFMNCMIFLDAQSIFRFSNLFKWSLQWTWLAIASCSFLNDVARPQLRCLITLTSWQLFSHWEVHLKQEGIRDRMLRGMGISTRTSNWRMWHRIRGRLKLAGAMRGFT